MAILYVHVVAMELHLNHFPDKLVHTAGYCAQELRWLWLKLISATTELLGCTSGVLSPYNLKFTASRPQSIVLDTATRNQIVQQKNSTEIFSKLFSPYCNKLRCEQQTTLHTIPGTRRPSFFPIFVFPVP